MEHAPCSVIRALSVPPHSGGIFRYQRQVYERQMITLIMICRQQTDWLREEGWVGGLSHMCFGRSCVKLNRFKEKFSSPLEKACIQGMHLYCSIYTVKFTAMQPLQPCSQNWTRRCHWEWAIIANRPGHTSFYMGKILVCSPLHPARLICCSNIDFRPEFAKKASAMQPLSHLGWVVYSVV